MIKQNRFANVTAIITTLFVVLTSSFTEAKTNKHRSVCVNEVRKLKSNKGYKATGVASVYGYESGSITATGQCFNPLAISAAHKHMKIPSYATIINLTNNKTIRVLINDRGPYVKGRLLDLSLGAARLLGIHGGLAKVQIIGE